MSLRRQRLAKGLCPECGEEAAPYRLCARHREMRRVGRIADRLAALGQVERRKVNGRIVYERKADRPDIDLERHFREPKPGDRRFSPRIGNIPVDVEREIVAIFLELNRRF